MNCLEDDRVLLFVVVIALIAASYSRGLSARVAVGLSATSALAVELMLFTLW